MRVKGLWPSSRNWWRVLTMVLWSVIVLILQTEGSCTYDMTPESACDETNLLDVREVDTIEECQQACTANSACFVAAVSIPICQFYPDNTPPVPYADWTYLKRVCTEPTTEATTTTTPTTTTTSTITAYLETATVDTIQSASSCTSTPAVTTESSTPTTTAQPTTATFNTTTITTTTTIPVDTTTAAPTTTTTTAAPTTTTTTPAPTTTTTTPAPTTTTTTPAPTPTTASKMTRQVSITTTVPAAYVIREVSQCEEACRVVRQCQTYTQSTTTCSLYESSPGAIFSQPGSTLGTRVECSNGSFCCFKPISNMAGDDNMAVSYTRTLTSCENVCELSSHCKAVIFDNSTSSCSLYTAVPDTQQARDSLLTLSSKTSDFGKVFNVAYCRGFVVKCHLLLISGLVALVLVIGV